jgi:hypothetical protein
MKVATKAKLGFAVMVGLLSMSMYVVAKPGGGKGIGFGPHNNPARVSPKPTPPGHHFGWEKGKHNPHAIPTP